MKRRGWLQAVGTGAFAAWAMQSSGDDAVWGQVAAEEPSVHTEVMRLRLRHTWTTTMSSSDYRDTLLVRYTRDGRTGIGEGAPIPRYHEDARSAQRFVEGIREPLQAADPRAFAKQLDQVLAADPGQWAAKAAIDIALLDWVGQHYQLPIYRLLGLDPLDAPITTFSIGIDRPDRIRQKVREAEAYPVLKIKVGLDSDEETIKAVRSVTSKPLRVDANEGWKDKETALAKIRWLADQGVEFVEQPMPAGMLDEQHWLKRQSPLPIFADEACQRPTDIPKLAEAFHGVNVKLDKAGGIQQAYRMILIARALGLKTMLGCMISSSVSVTAAAHLAPHVDFADLDGNLLIENDPYQGVKVEDGKLKLPNGPGLGLRRKSSEQ